MKRIGLILALLAIVPTSAFATILSFDLDATGVLEAAPDGTETNSCASSGLDICAQSLTFLNIELSGINATVTSNTSADGSGSVLWSWYDRTPAFFGGMGAAPENLADDSGNEFDGSADNAFNEYIIVTFSEAVLLDAFYFNGGNDTDHSDYTGTAELFLGGSAIAEELVNCAASLCNNADVVATSFAFWAGQDINYYLAGLSFSEFVPTPEPGIIALLGLGLIGIGYTRRRKS